MIWSLLTQGCQKSYVVPSLTYSHNYRSQRSCESYVFTGVCLSTGGVVSQHALQVVSQHALQQVSRGVVSQRALQQVSRGGACSGVVPAPGVCLLPGRGLTVPRGGGCLLPGRVPDPRGVPALGGCGGDPLASRWLLLRTVRILLECILVFLRVQNMHNKLILSTNNSVFTFYCEYISSLYFG